MKHCTKHVTKYVLQTNIGAFSKHKRGIENCASYLCKHIHKHTSTVHNSEVPQVCPTLSVQLIITHNSLDRGNHIS